MEAVLQNLRSTAELLSVVRTEAVGRWDPHTVDRAFQWALYCEHLHARFQANAAIRESMEKQLRATNGVLRAAFPGHTDLRFADLSRCQQLLLAGLLGNPAVPGPVLKRLFCGSGPTDAGGGGCHGNQLVARKSACKVLAAMATGPDSAPGPEAEVQGEMLMEWLGALGEAGATGTFLDSWLQSCEEPSTVCPVIAAALRRRGPNHGPAEGGSRDLLLDWSQINETLLQTMCSTLPSGHLAGLLRDNVAFRTVYRGVLRGWASQMVFDVGGGEWVRAGAAVGVSFKTLSDGFLLLLGVCPSLREDVEQELNVLKVSDGDFDVRGLSVWGDLLLELRKDSS